MQAGPPRINSQDNTSVIRTRDKMQEVEWTDDIGRKFIVFVKDGGDPAKGIIKGPTPLDALGLDEETNVRLHNELYDRGIITSHDASHNPMKVLGAIQYALRVNVQQIQNAYLGILEPPPSKPAKAEQPDTPHTEPDKSTMTVEDNKKEATNAR
jgi:hypothetical protein